MALVNDAKKEIHAKIVYLGPIGAGKNTALRYIFSKLRPECRSELKCMAVGGHQMLFFDFSYPLANRSDGYLVRFHVYTLLAGEGSALPWKMLLKGTDGVVFLADSSRERMFGNLECCTVLYDAFAHYDVTLADVPISLQCNKRDLADALPLDTLGRELFPESSEEPLAVSAVTGAGLLDGLNSLARQIMRNLGQSDAVAMVGDEPAAVAETPQEELPDDHCNADQPGFRVESAGDPQTAADGTVTLPLRLTGGACGKSVDFKVTVSVSI